MNKRIFYCISAALLVVPMINLLFVNGSAAAFETAYYDAAATAKVKMYFNAMMRCVRYSKNDGTTKNDAKSGDIFVHHQYWWDITLGPDMGGGWIESLVESRYDDGIIKCYSSDGQLVKQAASVLGTDVATLVCGPEGKGYDGDGGLVIRNDDNKNGHCRTYADKPWNPTKEYDFRGNTSTAYMETFFYPNIAKYSYGKEPNHWNPTAAEYYWINLNTFKVACGKESTTETAAYTRFDNIAVLGNNGEMKITSFDPYSNTTKEVRNWTDADGNISKIKCDALAKNISPESNEFKEAQKLMHAKVNADCRNNKGYHEQLTTLKKENQDIANNAESSQEDKDKANSNLEKINTILTNEDYIEIDDATKKAQCIQILELGLTATSNVDPGTTVDGAPAPPSCYNQGGAISWILCPVIQIVKNAGEAMYESVEENLVVNNALLDTSRNEGTYKAWGVFRDMANVALVIVFLIVIISQLTGAGVSNYGIKKALPRIIIAALLINLSFIICQLAVDLSNILGSNLKVWLESIVEYEDVQGVGGAGGFSTFLSWVAAILAGGTIAIIGAGGIGPLIGIIAMAVITGVAALAVLFITLAIRQAGIVILIAIAPLAFACFVLPNTEGLFKKWLGIFKALIIVYPICGLLVGGSTMASNIILNNSIGGNIMVILAFILPAVSFFFIPSLLKNSLSSLNNIGAKLSGLGGRFGKSVGGKASNKIQNSDAMKYMGNKRQEAITAAKYGQYTGKNPLRKARSGISKAMIGEKGVLANTGYGKAMAQKAGALEATQEKADMTEFMDANRNADIGTLQKSLSSELSLGDKASSAKVRGAVTMLASKGGIGVEAIRSGYTGATTATDKSMGMLKNAMTDGANFGSIKAKAPGFMDAMVSAQTPVKDQSGKNALDKDGKLVIPPSASGFDFTKLNNEELASVSAKEMGRLRQASIAAGAQQEQLFKARTQEIVNDDALYAKVSNSEMLAAMGSPDRADPTSMIVPRGNQTTPADSQAPAPSTQTNTPPPTTPPPVTPPTT